MKYFTISELCRSNVATQLGIENTPNQYQHANMVKLIENLLDPIREAWGAPIYVNSGFRTARLNEAIGGARSSEHMEGRAVDITCRNQIKNKLLFGFIQSLDVEWRQLIWEKGDSTGPQWIHISFNENDNKKQILHLK